MPGSGVSPSLEILPRRGPQDLNWVEEGYLPWLGGVHYLVRGYKYCLWYLRSMMYPPVQGRYPPLVKVDVEGGVCSLGRGVKSLTLGTHTR